MAESSTFESMLAEVSDTRQRDARTPTGIRLGQAQRDVIEEHVRASTGLADVGPVTSFAGLDVLPSRSADKLELAWPDDEPAPAEPVQSGPEAPAVEQPSA